MRFFGRLARSIRHHLPLERINPRVLAALILISVVVIAYYAMPHITRLQEDVMLKIDPSAQRAYTYGISHMSSSQPEKYDFKRAQYLLELSRDMDPAYPSVNYQLSRIYFIQSQFTLALLTAEAEIRNSNGMPIPEVYYMKGLAEGFMEDYEAAAKDYETYITLRPDGEKGWAGYNDYAWVLLKAGKPDKALVVLQTGLEKYPTNAWLLTSTATALYELKQYNEAAPIAERAVVAANALTISEWRAAYPGNKPESVQYGLDTIRRASKENLQKILAARDAAH